MKNHPLTIINIILILVVGFSITPSLADDETLGRQAEQAGNLRTALTHYVAALQSATEGSSKDQQLREKIIKLAQKIQPQPAVPDEVIRYEGRAEAAVRNAKTPKDYLDAAKEYQKALRVAPWVASYYFNLGVVLEKAGKPAEAIQNLKLYLLASPVAPDARDVKKKIAGLGYEQEKARRDIATKRQAEKEDRQRAEEEIQRKIAGLSGVWHEQNSPAFVFRVNVSGTRLIIETIPRGVIRRADYSRLQIVAPHTNGASLTGGVRDWVIMCLNDLGEFQAKGEITNNWRKIVIRYRSDNVHLGPSPNVPSSQCTWMGTPSYRTFTLVRN